MHGALRQWRTQAGVTLGGSRFPIFALCVIAGFGLVVTTLAFVPSADTGVGALGDRFRVLCLGASPDQGPGALRLAANTLIECLGLAAVIAGIWWPALRGALAQPRSFVGPVASALGVVLATVVSLATVARTPDAPIPPFPGARIRLSVPAPDVALVDPAGRTVSLAQFRGAVVLVTGVYSSCGTTCPRLLREIRDLLHELPASTHADFHVLAITLDPEHDSATRRSALAHDRGLDTGRFHFVGGAPAQVHAALDALDIFHRRDSVSGVVDHANVHVLIDRSGRVAFRLAQGTAAGRWLAQAARVLLAE